jgi:hypothetical protein
MAAFNVYCLTTQSVPQTTWSWMAGLLVSNEMKSKWKELVVDYSRQCTGIPLEGLRKTMKNVRISGVPADIWSDYRPRCWIQKHYRFKLRISRCWHVTPCSLVHCYQLLEGNCCFYLLLWVNILLGTRQRSWLRHCATSRKVAGSIPDEVIGFFNWPNPYRSRDSAVGMSTGYRLDDRGVSVRVL